MTELTDNERISRQKELIEEFGNHMQQTGGQQLCGRILGLLTFSDADEFTFDEIVQELQVSKSSVSVALNTLLMTNKVEYFTRPGDRKRYFRVKVMPMDAAINEMMAKVNYVYEIHQKALQLKADKNSNTAKHINNILSGISFFRQMLDNYKVQLIYGNLEAQKSRNPYSNQ